MSSSAGKVLLMPKGEYNPVTTYYIYDVVYYETNNSKGLYVAKQTTTGVAPTNTTNWQILIDLTNYISTLDIATQQELGVIKSDGMTTEVSITGVLKALGVGIVCTINPSGTEHGANWLKFGNDVITPDTRQMYRVNVDGKEFLFFWNGTQYIQLSGGGHTVTQNVNGSILPMAGRAYLQLDDPTNDSTVIKPQIQICATETEWNQMSDAQKNDPLVYWYLPWAPDNVYSQDKTPVGTVITVATGKTGDGITDIYTPTNNPPFPNKDYLVCNGNQVPISDYPQLANHFETVYGDKFYFTNGVDPGNGRFQLPNWEADYPENGIICIKARITSDVITLAEVDETGLSSRTDEVPSCARVADIEEDVSEMQGVQMAVNEELGWVNGNTFICTYGAKGAQAWTCMSPFSTAKIGNKYVRFRVGETYRLTIRNNLCRAMKIGETSFKDLISYIDHIEIVPLQGAIRFYFSSPPYGTSDCCLIIGGDLSIKRIS